MKIHPATSVCTTPSHWAYWEGGRMSSQRPGDKNSNWGGDSIGYVAAHVRLGPARGKTCVDCDGPAAQWSLSKEADQQSLRAVVAGAHKGRIFSLDSGSYDARCHRCHRSYDGPGR